MSEPLIFDTASPRFALPLLFVGQAQKEAFVNEALSLVDGLLHCAVEGVLDTPPAAPLDGQAWLIGASPAGVWSGRAGQLALRQGGNWIFVPPRDGMRVLDRATGQDRRYRNGWLAATVPAAPSGGTTIDAEARTAIGEIIARLRTAGILPQP
ncbi:MAG TPA: DUF2793 domain-containing protein [Novosphingobium sp.]|nr:DUF2793 domain-containing protein [Novosphingobium sp.]